VARGADAAKDQSYVVHMLDQPALARTQFPVGHLTKARVRERAVELGLRTAAKPDSQDVCFITKRGRAVFLGDRIPLKAARVVDEHGAPLGELPAVELVTVGQRRGVGPGGTDDRRYVTSVDVVGGVVTVGPAEHLLDGHTAVGGLQWIAARANGPLRVQTSAHGATSVAEVRPAGDGHQAVGVTLVWSEPHRRVAAGQTVVLYDLDDRIVLGGGIAV
jgi:tRNA-specific 2-thiouridylase